MSHQPFEDWLLDATALSTEAEHLLQEHLAACARCRALADAWAQVEAQMHRAEAIGPEPGFAQRWRARREAEEAQRRRRQPWRLLAVFCAAGLPLALLLLARTVALLQSPAYLALTWMEWLAALVARLYWLMNVLGTILKATHASHPALLALALAAGLGMLGTLWLASIYRFAVQGGVR